MRAVFISLAILLAVPSFGQAPALSGAYDKKPLLQLIEDIERQTNYRFFFDRRWIDTARVTTQFQNAQVTDILRNALKSSRLEYYMDGSRVILTNNVPILEGIDYQSQQTEGARNYSFMREYQQQTEEAAAEQKIYEVGKKGAAVSAGLVALTGYVKDAKSGEPIPGAYVYVENPMKGITTNQFGYYTLYLDPGPYTLKVQFTGMKLETRPIVLHSSGQLDVTMKEDIISLKEVTVESERESNIYNVQMGSALLDMRAMKTVPKVLGENDILKVALTMPGVSTIGEGAAGISVRGGNMDQNLMIISEAPIYNPNHFLGFFSIFNADAIKTSELYKSGFPAQFGGRLSSILDLQLKEGNRNKWGVQGGISPVTTQLMAEVPLIKEKTSLIVGGRTTYSDWILKTLSIKNLKNSEASFYDFFAKLSHEFDENNWLYFTYYASKDKFKLTFDSLFTYRNEVASLQWRHLYKNKMQSVVSLTDSRYDYSIDYSKTPESAFTLGFNLRESGLKADFNLNLERHKIDFGFQARYYRLNPGYLDPVGSSSTVIPEQVQHQQGLESGLYVADNFDLTDKISFYAGLRYSLFSFLGPYQLSVYAPNVPKDDISRLGTQSYSDGGSIINYYGLEPRASVRFVLPKESSIKLNYSRTRQYIHMLSNTVSISPTNTWTLSDPNIKPQIADQVSAGYYRNLWQGVVEASVEAYYKEMQNVLDYKTGSELILNKSIEQDILQGKGRAYGVEFLLRKKTGKVNGWVSYTHARTFLQMTSSYKEETINQGDYFPANYDRPHNLNIVFNYRITRRYSMSSNFTYSTGRPITYPVGVYQLGNTYQINYSDRNAYRIPDYFRWDLGFNIDGNHKIKKLAHGFWTISIYNVLGRHNPYSVYFKSVDGNVSGYQLSIFGAPIPTITYNFKF